MSEREKLEQCASEYFSFEEIKSNDFPPIETYHTYNGEMIMVRITEVKDPQLNFLLNRKLFIKYGTNISPSHNTYPRIGHVSFTIVHYCEFPQSKSSDKFNFFLMETWKETVWDLIRLKNSEDRRKKAYDLYYHMVYVLSVFQNQDLVYNYLTPETIAFDNNYFKLCNFEHIFNVSDCHNTKKSSKLGGKFIFQNEDYHSPEKIEFLKSNQTFENFDHLRSDVFSLGLVLLNLLIDNADDYFSKRKTYSSLILNFYFIFLNYLDFQRRKMKKN